MRYTSTPTKGRPDTTPRRKPKPKGKAPAGPYRSESSDPSIRAKATPTDRKTAKKGRGRTAHRARRYAREDRRRREQAAAFAQPTLKASAARQRREEKIGRKASATLRRLSPISRSPALHRRPTASGVKERKTPDWMTFTPPKDAGLLHAVERDVIRPAQEAKVLPKGKTLGQKVYQRVAEYGPAVITLQPELSAGAKALAAGARGVTAGEAKIGGSRALGRVLKPIKAEGASARAVTKRAAEKAGTKASSTGARGAAKRAGRAALRTERRADKAVIRRITGTQSRREAAAHGGAPLKLTKATATQNAPVVRGHEKALVENPRKTAKTTLRAIPGLVTYPVGVAAAGGITAGRAGSEALHEAGVPGFRGYSGKEILAPAKGEVDETIAFAKQVAKVLTADDPDYVQREVEDNLGLLLPIMLGLGGSAIAKGVSKTRVREAVRRIAENVRERRGTQHGHRNGKAPRVLERTGQRKESAKVAAEGRTRLRRELADRQRGMVEAARGARGKEVVREGVTRKRAGRKGDLEIRDADVASFLQRNPMKMDDPVAMLAEVKRIKSRLKEPTEGMKFDPAKLYTREVIDYIERHPDVLANPDVLAVVREYRKQGRYARERSETLAPEHSERARFLSAATTRDIPFPEEMYPRSVRDIVRAEPKRGKLAKDVLRREARSDRSRARKLKRQAATAKSKAAVLRREGGAAFAGRADRFDKRATTLREQAKAAEEMATRKQKASREVDPSLTPEFAGIVKERLNAEGITELPEYQYAGPGREHGAPVYGSSGTKLTQFPGRSKKRKGTAEEFGLVEEGLTPMVRESIARPIARRESYKVAREVIEGNEFAPGGKREWSAAEADELFAGTDPVLSSKQWMKVPRQFYKRIYDVLEGKKGGEITAKDFELVGQLATLREGKPPPGSHYKIVRSAAMEELVGQLSNAFVSPKLAKVNRGTSYLILATSPAWAAMQVVAEYGQAVVAQPKLLNPAFVRKAIREYKAMAPEKRQAFDSWVGVTTRTIERAEDLKLDLKAGDMESAANAYGALDATPYGRFLKGIPTSIRRIDQWKGGRIRALQTLAKIDKDLNSHANLFLRGIGGLHREMGKALGEMRGLPLHKQAEWVAEHPKWAKRYRDYLDDVMGNWSALTKNERVAAQAIIFYPFVRMSLRWTFYAFPKRHPVKAAMLYYLGQQNANEVAKLLHGDPSYFTQWAMVPVDLGGERKFLDLSRIAPGSNAFVEALGGSAGGPKGIAAARIAQPFLAALGTAIYGVAPLTGKQEKGSGWNALAQLLGLSPLSRAASEATLPKGRKRSEGLGQLPVIGSLSTERQEALDKLVAKLREYGSPERYLRTLALPPFPKDVGKERDSAMLGRILRAFERNSSDARDSLSAEYAERMRNAVLEGKGGLPKLRRERDKRLVAMEAEYDEADRKLDQLFEHYGVPYKREDKLFLQYYAEGKYGKKPKARQSQGSIGGEPIGSIGGPVVGGSGGGIGGVPLK